jgi:hypothetical protein
MFYFFEKAQRYVRCEVVERDGNWSIVILEPDSEERTEDFPTSNAAHARWQELQAAFTNDGWFGPYGRD